MPDVEDTGDTFIQPRASAACPNTGVQHRSESPSLLELNSMGRKTDTQRHLECEVRY